jgi:hypothetical protein
MLDHKVWASRIVASLKRFSPSGKYRIKSLIQGEELTQEELADKSARMDELMAISHSFRLTQKEMTKFIFKGLFRKQIS